MHPMTVRQVFYQATVRGIASPRRKPATSRPSKAVAWLRRNGYVRFPSGINRRHALRPQAHIVSRGLEKPSACMPKPTARPFGPMPTALTWRCSSRTHCRGSSHSVTSGVAICLADGCAGLPLHHVPGFCRRADRPFADVPHLTSYHLGDYDPSAQGCRPGHGGRATGAGSRRGDPLQANRGHAASDRGLEPADAAHRAVRHACRLLPWGGAWSWMPSSLSCCAVWSAGASSVICRRRAGAAQGGGGGGARTVDWVCQDVRGVSGCYSPTRPRRSRTISIAWHTAPRRPASHRPSTAPDPQPEALDPPVRP